MNKSTKALLAGLVLALLAVGGPARAERIKDLASIAGVRPNQLVGYGIVVGLDGSGDQTTQTPFTVQSMINMLSNLGVNLPPGSTLQLKNVAAVMVTASIPPFARPGQQIDVTVSSLGNAKSLRGGTLVMTPLKGADGNIYAMAQGNLVVGGAGGQGGGSSVTVNHLSAGRIAGGATVERAVPTPVGIGDTVIVELNTSDFGTVERIVSAVNEATSPGTARAIDGRQVSIRAPADPNARVAFLGRIENLNIQPMQTAAKVIVNSRTGSVVMNQAVTLQNCAVAHGNLSVTVSSEPVISQPAPLSGGKTVVTEKADVEVKQEPGSLIRVRSGASLAEVVKSLNGVGATPLDLVSILQAMKAAGSLRADLEII